MQAFIYSCYGTPITPRSAPLVSSWRGPPVKIYKHSLFTGSRVLPVPRALPTTGVTTGRRGAFWAMFGGGGLLGVGPSEVIVIVAVGWLLLGPQKLLALAKDSGKILGQLRRTANDAKDTFSEALDLDTLAAELNLSSETKPPMDKIVVPKTDEVLEKDTDIEIKGDGKEEDAAQELSPQGATTPVAESTTGVSEAFLEQLRRVSDPEQIAPADVLDIGVDNEEEEVERLEREYIAAKSRLEARKEQTKANETKPLESVKEEG